MFKIKYAVDVWLVHGLVVNSEGKGSLVRVTHMIQSSEDSDFLVDFVHLVFLFCLDGLTSHLAVIHSIKCEVDCSKASAPKAMGCDCVFSNRLIPTLGDVRDKLDNSTF